MPGRGVCSDKELNFNPVICWNCGGKCIVDEHTGTPKGGRDEEFNDSDDNTLPVVWVCYSETDD